MNVRVRDVFVTFLGFRQITERNPHGHTYLYIQNIISEVWQWNKLIFLQVNQVDL